MKIVINHEVIDLTCVVNQADEVFIPVAPDHGHEKPVQTAIGLDMLFHLIIHWAQTNAATRLRVQIGLSLDQLITSGDATADDVGTITLNLVEPSAPGFKSRTRPSRRTCPSVLRTLAPSPALHELWWHRACRSWLQP